MASCLQIAQTAVSLLRIKAKQTAGTSLMKVRVARSPHSLTPSLSDPRSDRLNLRGQMMSNFKRCIICQIKEFLTEQADELLSQGM
ncbi:hypothetical protein AOLI_G00194530 [Acnodon oligacanthus]